MSGGDRYPDPPVSADPGARRPAGWRDKGARLGCAAIVAVGAVMLGLSAHNSWQLRGTEVARHSVHANKRAYRQEECIYHAIRTQLPENAKVYIDEPVVGWAQRLAELSTLWAVPQQSSATAQYAISVVRGQACHGWSLKVTRL